MVTSFLMYRYYRDAQQALPSLKYEEPAAAAQAERKALDPEQLLQEAEEEAGNIDEVHAPRIVAQTCLYPQKLTAGSVRLSCHCRACRNAAHASAAVDFSTWE